MALQRATKDKIDFVYAGGTNINPSKDAHMHALGIEFTDDDHIVQRWVLFEAGKQAGINTLTLSRVSE